MSRKPQRGGRGREETQSEDTSVARPWQVPGGRAKWGAGAGGWKATGGEDERSGEIRGHPGPGGRGAKPGSLASPPTKV